MTVFMCIASVEDDDYPQVFGEVKRTFNDAKEWCFEQIKDFKEVFPGLEWHEEWGDETELHFHDEDFKHNMFISIYEKQI